MFMRQLPPRCCAWQLSCWEERGSGAPMAWRSSLEDPRTGERRGFASLEALSAFLRAELARGCDEPPAGDPSPAGQVVQSRAPTEGG